MPPVPGNAQFSRHLTAKWSTILSGGSAGEAGRLQNLAVELIRGFVCCFSDQIPVSTQRRRTDLRDLETRFRSPSSPHRSCQIFRLVLSA